MKGSRSFFFQNIVHTVRQRLDVILITSILGTHAAGVYGASLTLIQRLDIVQDALTTALFPRVSSLQGQATDPLRELVRLSLKLMLVFRCRSPSASTASQRTS
ncbi:MAG: oligosaccharide flippase family protein [Betaproteobacteria bacterium]|nr:oligosaccharide flippase family protein [Betaproteobacteria bacterium]